MYSDNHRKLVAITNPKYSFPQRQNAVIHATVGLVSFVGIEAFETLPYLNEDLQIDAQISLYPNVCLTAKNGSQLLASYHQANSACIACNIFTESMLGGSAAEQIQKTRDATVETIGPIALVLFGNSEALTPITKRFSVLKD